MNESRLFYQFARFEVMDQWWHWLILASVLLALFSYVVYWYRKDWQQLPMSLGLALLFLRLVALSGLIFFFFDLQRRSEERIVRPSRLALLLDTSLSMSLPNDLHGDSSQAPTRLQSAIDFLTKSAVLEQLRSQHDLAIYRFDQMQRPTLVAALARPKDISSITEGNPHSSLELWRSVSRMVWLGTIGFSAALLGLVIGLTARIRGSKHEHWPHLILFSSLLAMAAMILVATAVLRGSEFSWSSFWSFETPQPEALKPESDSAMSNPNDLWVDAENQLKSLAATGVETRLGDVIQTILEKERGTPLAGIVLITDGQSNAGVEPTSVITQAAAASVPIYAIGVGSPDDPVNVRVVDVEAPKRVYPGDRFRLTALLQATGLQGKACTIQLRRKSVTDGQDSFTIEEEQTVALGNEDTMQSIAFDIKPREIGNWIYDVKILPPIQDTNAQDNQLDTEIRVVEPRSTVMIIAGGPTREYQFVRNLLFRDQTVQSHVYLQTGSPGMSQEADKLLTEFPKTAAEMAQYDCVIAFDVDWMALSIVQIEILERWVAQQAGGLILVLGPVKSPNWTGTSGNGDRRAEAIRNLSPMVLNGRGSRLVSMGRFESETVWPLKFTDDARNMDFLQLSSNAEENQRLWMNFAGVYNYYASYEPKAGALPVAYFSDPATSMEGKLPVYLATQFYGAGRVVAQGSGEMWRLRQLSDSYFDAYYTKLVRWASQSRLLRDSDRGLLLLDKQQALVGEQISVRAVLRDEQFQPLIIPSTTAKIIDPSKKTQPLELVPLKDPSQLGTYIGQFLVKQTGSYEVRLPVGNLASQQIISQQVTVRIPTREIQRPQRNDPVLLEITNKTGGQYFLNFADALEPSPFVPDATQAVKNQPGCRLTAAIAPREQVNFLPGAPDRNFQQRLMATLMALIALALSLEWLLRRLSKLA